MISCCDKRKSATVADAERGKANGVGGALQLRLWRCLDSRETASFVMLVRDAVDIDSSRPPGASSPLAETCPGSSGCRGKETLLIRACYLSATEEVKVLLECGADPNRACADGCAPLHHCALAGAVGCMRALLADPRTDPNVQSADGYDALHVCAYDPSWRIKDKDSLLLCIKLLLVHPRFLANKVNKWGQTPLVCALLRYYEERVRVMLEYGKSKIDLDWRMFFGQPLRTLIKVKFPKLESLMPSRREENVLAKNPNIKLLANLQTGNIETFKVILYKENVDLNYFFADPYYCTIIEIACRIPGYEDMVQVLLDAGVNPNTVNKIDKSPLIHQAAICANYKALKILLSTKCLDITVLNDYDETALHVATQGISPGEENIRAMEQTVHMLLDYQSSQLTSLNINARDKGGDTALLNAAYFGLDSIVLLLLRRGANMTMRNERGEPPVIYFGEETLRTHLDEQIDSNGLSPQSEMFELIFRYDSLVPSAAEDDDLAEMHPINCITDTKDLVPVLRHPLISTFLYLKWSNVKNFFLYNLLIYFLFVICLTTYSVLINMDLAAQQNMTCRQMNVTEHGNGSSAPWPEIYSGEKYFNANLSSIASVPPEQFELNSTNCDSQDKQEDQEYWFGIILLRCLLSLFLVFLLIREGSQLFILGYKYFVSAENIMELLLIFGTGFIIFSPFLNDTWDRHICGITILLAWTELILVSGRLPVLSIQLEMFKKVSVTFVKFMAWYSLILLAFAFSFFVLFNGEEPFYSNPWLSIVKTVIMLAGEFEASNLNFSKTPVTSHVIFILFVCLIAIVLLNLLNGLAVYDTQAIKDDATVLSLVSMVRIINYIENFLQKFLMFCRKCNLKRMEMYIRKRIQIFNHSIPKKQIHVFPSSGEIRFLLDIETTKKFETFRVQSSVLNTSTDIVINRNQETELRKIQGAISEFSDKLNAIEDILKGININIGK